MLETLPTCGKCGASMGWEATACPRCGAARAGRSLMVAPAPWRQVAGPAAAGLALAAASVGVAVVRHLVQQWMASQGAGQGARVRVEESAAVARPARGWLVRRRVWAVGDGQGLRAWGVEETTWQPEERE